jgi:microcystin-dependent protein
MRKKILSLAFLCLSSLALADGETPIMGEVVLFPYNFAPVGWRLCDGSLLSIADYGALFAIIGTTYGGDGQSTFALPNLKSRTVVGAGQGPGLPSYVLGQTGGTNLPLGVGQMPSHSHSISPNAPSSNTGRAISPLNNFPSAGVDKNRIPVMPFATGAPILVPALANAGGSLPHEQWPPYVKMNYCIATEGVFPSNGGSGSMPDDSMIGDIKIFAGNFQPNGAPFCDGRLLQIMSNQALFSLLGTTYGGDGRNTFGLPDLRGRAPIHLGSGYTQGQMAGEIATTLLASQMPAHTHVLNVSAAECSDQPANLATPIAGSRLGRAQDANGDGVFLYSNPAASMGSTVISGQGQAHNTMPPYVSLNYIIVTQGIFPSRN